LQAIFRRSGCMSCTLALPRDSDPASWLANRGSKGIEVFLRTVTTGSTDCFPARLLIPYHSSDPIGGSLP
jgi:hypothetical protein